MVWWMDEQIDKYIDGQIVGQRDRQTVLGD